MYQYRVNALPTWLPLGSDTNRVKRGSGVSAEFALNGSRTATERSNGSERSPNPAPGWYGAQRRSEPPGSNWPPGGCDVPDSYHPDTRMSHITPTHITMTRVTVT